MKNDVPQNRGEIGFDHPSQDKKSVDLTPVLREVNFVMHFSHQDAGCNVLPEIVILSSRGPDVMYFPLF